VRPEDLGVAVTPDEAARREAEAAQGQTEGEKARSIFQRLEEVNQQLGGELVYEIPSSDEKSVLIFKVAGYSSGDEANRFRGGRYPGIFGVHSEVGPIRLFRGRESEIVQKDITAGLINLPEEISSGSKKLDPKDWIPVRAKEDIMEPGRSIKEWGDAFERSKDRVLHDQKIMEAIRAERNRTLDQAFNIVSQPIDTNAPQAS